MNKPCKWCNWIKVAAGRHTRPVSHYQLLQFNLHHSKKFKRWFTDENKTQLLVFPHHTGFICVFRYNVEIIPETDSFHCNTAFHQTLAYSRSSIPFTNFPFRLFFLTKPKYSSSSDSFMSKCSFLWSAWFELTWCYKKEVEHRDWQLFPAVGGCMYGRELKPVLLLLPCF